MWLPFPSLASSQSQERRPSTLSVDIWGFKCWPANPNEAKGGSLQQEVREVTELSKLTNASRKGLGFPQAFGIELFSGNRLKRRTIRTGQINAKTKKQASTPSIAPKSLLLAQASGSA